MIPVRVVDAQGLATSMKVLTFFDELYVQPFKVNPLTVNLTAVVFLPSVELVTLQLPAPPVMQVVAPDPADQIPATETPATGPCPSTTVIVTVEVHPLRPEVAVPTRPPTHISWAAGGELTATVELADAIAPSSSVTVSPTV